MNKTLEQFNALVTSVRMVENENAKLQSKLEELEAEDKLIQEDLKKAEEDLARSEQNTKTLNEEHKKNMTNLEEELTKLKETAKARQEETDLYFEIKELEKEAQKLQKSNEFLKIELEDVKAGKLTPNFSLYLQNKNATDEKKKLLEHFGKNLKIEKQSGVITMTSIAKIFEATILYYSKDHITKTYEDRIERRKHMNSIEEYMDIAVKQLNDFDNLVDAAQLELLEKVGLKLDDFSSSVEVYFTQGNQDVYYLTSTLPQKLKMFIPSRKRLNPTVVKDLLKHQKEVLPKEFAALDILKKYKDELTPDRVTTLLSNRLFDRVYEKLNVEEEDFLASMQIQEVRNDYEIKDLLLEVRNAILENTPKTINSALGEGAANMM